MRYRTVGDLTVTGAVRSEAADIAAMIEEIGASRVTERGETRADDRTSEAAMEDRKREGYFVADAPATSCAWPRPARSTTASRR